MGRPVFPGPGHGRRARRFFRPLDLGIFAVVVFGRGDRKLFRRGFYFVLQQLFCKRGFVRIRADTLIVRLRWRRLLGRWGRRRWRRRLVRSAFALLAPGRSSPAEDDPGGNKYVVLPVVVLPVILVVLKLGEQVINLGHANGYVWAHFGIQTAARC